VRGDDGMSEREVAAGVHGLAVLHHGTVERGRSRGRHDGGAG
jgi:hypothetical protein